MPGVRITSVDDDTIAWGAGQDGVGAYLRSVSRIGPSAIGNATFALSVLQLEDRAFSLAVPSRGTCWLTSLAATYGKAARDETTREVAGVQAVLFHGLSHAAEAFLRLDNADAVVFANHLMLSTSLYGDWNGADDQLATTSLGPPSIVAVASGCAIVTVR